MENRIKFIFSIKRVQDALNTKLGERTLEQRRVIDRTYELLNHIGNHKVY
jgi:hypothetical protein